MRYAYVTGAGGRDENQDASGCVIVGGVLTACVCDGLGGHGGGKAAADAALEAALNAPGDPARRIQAANEAVVRGQRENPSMRTTILVLRIEGGKARWAHCGDSRLYRIRDGAMEQLTLDHSVPQALARVGEIELSQIRYHEDRARLTRALGSPECKWDEDGSDALPGDIYLLASDGLWEPVDEGGILACLADNPEDFTARLENAVLRAPREDADNYTALAVFI